MVFPKLGFFPQISHANAMGAILQRKNFERYKLPSYQRFPPAERAFTGAGGWIATSFESSVDI
jgi:hypothetical protein